MPEESGNRSILTHAEDGSEFVPLATQFCKRVTIFNDAGVNLDVRQVGSEDVAVPIYPNTVYTFQGLENANQIEVRRADLESEPVEVKYRFEMRFDPNPFYPVGGLTVFPDGSVETPKLAAGAVTRSKIASKAVGAQQIDESQAIGLRIVTDTKAARQDMIDSSIIGLSNTESAGVAESNSDKLDQALADYGAIRTSRGGAVAQQFVFARPIVLPGQRILRQEQGVTWKIGPENLVVDENTYRVNNQSNSSRSALIWLTPDANGSTLEMFGILDCRAAVQGSAGGHSLAIGNIFAFGCKNITLVGACEHRSANGGVFFVDSDECIVSGIRGYADGNIVQAVLAVEGCRNSTFRDVVAVGTPEGLDINNELQGCLFDSMLFDNCQEAVDMNGSLACVVTNIVTRNCQIPLRTNISSPRYSLRTPPSNPLNTTGGTMDNNIIRDFSIRYDSDAQAQSTLACINIWKAWGLDLEASIYISDDSPFTPTNGLLIQSLAAGSRFRVTINSNKVFGEFPVRLGLDDKGGPNNCKVEVNFQGVLSAGQDAVRITNGRNNTILVHEAHALSGGGTSAVVRVGSGAYAGTWGNQIAIENATGFGRRIRSDFEPYGTLGMDEQQPESGVVFAGLSNQKGIVTMDRAIGTDSMAVRVRLTIPEVAPSAEQGVIAFSPSSSTAAGADAFIVAIGTAGNGLVVRKHNAANDGYVQLAFPDVHCLGGGRLVELYIERSGTALRVTMDGRRLTGTETTSGTGATWDSSIDSTYAWVGALSSSGVFVGTVAGWAVFNSTLSSAAQQFILNNHAIPADLRRAGVVNRNPSGHMGSLGSGDANVTTGWTDSGSNVTIAAEAGARTGGAGSYFARMTSVGAVTSGISCFFIDNGNISWVAGTTYRVTFWARASHTLSGTCNLRGTTAGTSRGSASFTLSAANTWQKVSVVITATGAGGGYSFTFAGGADGATYDFDDIEIVEAGAIFDHDFSEGIGYQAHDRSGNKLDCTLSGTAWLFPKTSGFVRAQTATNGNARLLGQNSLPANAVIDSWDINSAGTPTVSLGSASGGSQYKTSGALASGRQRISLVTNFAASQDLYVASNGTDALDHIVRYHTED